MNAAHRDMDDTAEYSDRCRAKNGLTRQGRDMAQADVCTTTDEHGAESKWDSADDYVTGLFSGASIWLLKASVAVFSALLLADALNAGLLRLTA